MRTANAHFQGDAILGCKAVDDVDMEIWKRGEEVLIIAMHCVRPLMVFTPRFVVIPCPVTKGGHDSWQVVGVFATYVFFYDC